MFGGAPTEQPIEVEREETPEEEVDYLRELTREPAPQPIRRPIQVGPSPEQIAAEKAARLARLEAEANRIAAEEAAERARVAAEAPFSGFEAATRITGESVADPARARTLLRDAIKRTLAIGTENASGPLRIVGQEELVKYHADALFWPNDRSVAFSEDVINRANAAIRKLEQGPLSLTPETMHELDGLRIMLHEELHAMSGSNLAGVRNAQSVIVEEIGTELSARRVIRSLAPQVSLNDAGRAYQNEIVMVRYALQKLTKIPSERLLEMMAEAHEKTALARAVTTPEEAVNSWLDALGLTDSQKADMLKVLAAVQAKVT